MPQIIVVADRHADRRDRAVMFTERVSVRDFESRHFQTQLVERLGWAVEDAHAAEQAPEPVEASHAAGEPDRGRAWEEDAPGAERERRSLSGLQPVS